MSQFLVSKWVTLPQQTSLEAERHVLMDKMTDWVSHHDVYLGESCQTPNVQGDQCLCAMLHFSD